MMKSKIALFNVVFLISLLYTTLTYGQEKPRIGVLRFTSMVENEWVMTDGTEAAKDILLNEFNRGPYHDSFKTVKIRNDQLLSNKTGADDLKGAAGQDEEILDLLGAAGQDEEILDLLNRKKLDFLFAGSIGDYAYDEEEISVTVNLGIFQQDGTLFMMEKEMTATGRVKYKNQEEDFLELLQPLFSRFIAQFADKLGK